MSAKQQIKNAYDQALSNYNVGNSVVASSDNPIVIGGINYGSKWNDQDAAIYEAYMAQLGFQNELALLDYQNEYNSPDAQVKRMRAAGLNPDLQGVESYGSASATSPQPHAPAGSNLTDGLGLASQAMHVLPAVTSSIQTAIGTYTGLLSSLNAIDKQEIDLAKDKVNLSRDLFKLYGGGRNKESQSGSDPTVNVFRIMGPRKASQRRWANSVSNMWNQMENGSLPDFGTRADAVGDEVRYNKNRVERVSGFLTSDELESDLAGTINDFRRIIKATFRYQKEFDYQLAYDKFNYQKQYDGKAAAERDMAQIQFEKVTSQFQNDNIDVYLESDFAERKMKKAIAEYREAYESAMKSLIDDRGLIGMTAAMAFAESNPGSTGIGDFVTQWLGITK